MRLKTTLVTLLVTALVIGLIVAMIFVPYIMLGVGVLLLAAWMFMIVYEIVAEWLDE